MSRTKVIQLGVLFGILGLLIHFSDDLGGPNLYLLWSQTDVLAHFASGVGLAALLAVLIDRFNLPTDRAMKTLLLSQLALAILWEVYEALPEPYGYGYHARYPNYGYLNDTTGDVAIVMLGAFVVVFILGKYRGEF